jgi:hypothetical protein
LGVIENAPGMHTQQTCDELVPKSRVDRNAISADI